MPLECESTRFLIDPGQLGPGQLGPGQLGASLSLEGIDAVLITHGQFDHLDPQLLARAEVPVYAPADVAAEHPEIDIHVLEPGAEIKVGTVSVQAFGERHAAVHPTIPGPEPRGVGTGKRSDACAGGDDKGAQDDQGRIMLCVQGTWDYDP